MSLMETTPTPMAMTQALPRCQPLFIVGYPRSGTTLLLHMLLGSGEFPVYPFTETHFYSHHFRRYGKLSNDARRSRFLAAVSEADWVKSTRMPITEIVRLWERRGATYGEFLRVVMDVMAASQGKSHWVEKTPWHILYLREIQRDFPEARFIHIVRDPRDTCLSVWKAGWIGGRIADFAAFALSWQWYVRRGTAFMTDNRDIGITIRYEDLVTEPSAVLGSVNRLLGTSMELESIVRSQTGVLTRSNTSHAQSMKGISSAAVGRWRESDQVHKLEVVDALAGRTMRAHGYKPRVVSKLFNVGAPPARLSYSGYRGLRQMAFPAVRR